MSNNLITIPINNRYVFNVVYKGICMVFNDTNTNINTLVEKGDNNIY